MILLVNPVSRSKEPAATAVTFQRDDNAQKVDVIIGGKYFTSLIYPGDP